MTTSLFACMMQAIVVVGLSSGLCVAAEPLRLSKGSLVQRGTASYYADKFHGRKTASGELLDQNDFTAASKSLPFGTYARVIDPETGRSVRVRINDRGPFTPGRIIDLSKRAAAVLSIGRHNGIARVVVEVRPRDQPTPALRAQIAKAAARQNAPAPKSGKIGR